MKHKYQFAIFYKSHNKWIGPYDGQLFKTKKDAEFNIKFWNDNIKSKCEVRKVKGWEKV